MMKGFGSIGDTWPDETLVSRVTWLPSRLAIDQTAAATRPAGSVTLLVTRHLARSSAANQVPEQQQRDHAGEHEFQRD
jgi:hypothetical protein